MTHDLKTSLDEFAEAAYADAPPSTVDISKARADGRRRVVVNRLAPVGGGVAVVAACALVVNALGGTAPAKNGPAEPGGSAGRTFTGTDPLTAVGRFAWLPDGFQTASYLTGPDYGNSVTARTASPSSTTGPVVPPALTLTSSPTEPHLPSYETKKEVALPGSQKAYLVTNPGDGPSIPADLSLMWQTASGNWYSLGGDYQIHGDQLEALLIKVAGSVTAETSPVALPIHVEGLPKDAVLGEASLDDPAVVGQGGFRVGLSYAGGSDMTADGSFDIAVSPTGWQDPRNQQHPVDPRVAALLANNHPAVTAPASKPVCKDADGLHICVGELPGKNGHDPLASVGGAQGLLDRITSLGTNRADWTTHVVN